MIRSIFDIDKKISMENDESVIGQDGVQDSALELSEAVAIEDDIEETAELQQEAQDEVAEFEENTEHLENIQEEVQKQEEIIEERPEEVTEDNVRVAQECLAYSIGKLGLQYSDFKSQRLSVEAHKDLPVEKLKITLEGLKEIIMKIVEKIKAIFVSIANLFRKLWQKFIILMDRTEKKAKSLQQKLKENGIVDEVTDDMRSKYVNKFGGFSSGKGKAISIESANDLIQKLPSSVFSTVTETIKQPDNKSIFTVIKNKLSSIMGLSSKLESSEFKKEVSNKASNYGLPYYFMNNRQKGLVFDSESETVRTIVINNVSKVEDFQNVSFSQNELDRLLMTAANNAKNTKTYIENVNKIHKEALKNIEDIGKKQDPAPQDKVKLSLFNKFGASVALDLSAQYIDFNKAIVSVAAKWIKLGK